MVEIDTVDPDYKPVFPEPRDRDLERLRPGPGIRANALRLVAVRDRNRGAPDQVIDDMMLWISQDPKWIGSCESVDDDADDFVRIFQRGILGRDRSWGSNAVRLRAEPGPRRFRPHVKAHPIAG